MTRKLTAHQSALGARAYSHNASRRAHALSQPRRERAMAGPVHGEYDGPECDLIRTFVHDEVCEMCGYHVCCKRGPCAPALPKAPESARGFKVGQRVRAIRSTPYAPLTVGREYVVLPPCPSHLELCDEERADYVTVECDDGDTDGYPVAMFEPLPTPQQAESDEEVLLRTGWMRNCGSTESVRVYTYGTTDWNRSVAGITRYSDGWSVARAGRDVGDRINGFATVLQAACAALGITIVIDGPRTGYHAVDGDGCIIGRDPDAESCARLALERHAKRGGQ